MQALTWLTYAVFAVAAAWALAKLSSRSPIGFWTLLCLAALATSFVTPEPVSHMLLLFGGGLAAVAAWRALTPKRRNGGAAGLTQREDEP